MAHITLTADTTGFNRPDSPGTVTAGTYDRIPYWDSDDLVCIDIGDEGLHPFWIAEDDECIEVEES